MTDRAEEAAQSRAEEIRARPPDHPLGSLEHPLPLGPLLAPDLHPAKRRGDIE